MRKILTILSIFMLASCAKQEAMLSDEEQAYRDSVALHIAVLPVTDCLPFYLAESTGIFDSLGVIVKLDEYNSQMDADSALQKGRVHIAYSELPRLMLMQTSKDSLLDAFMQMQGHVSLVTAKSKRIRTLKQLQEHLVGIDRHSTTDYYSDLLMQKAGLPQTGIYRPQFNDIRLRAKMLNDHLLDGAILPSPHDWVSVQYGNRLLWQSEDSTSTFSCMAAYENTLQDSTRLSQIRLIIQAYDIAIDALESKRDSVISIMHNRYGIDRAMLDSIPMPNLKYSTPVSNKNKETAEAWLREREKMPSYYHSLNIHTLDSTYYSSKNK